MYGFERAGGSPLLLKDLYIAVEVLIQANKGFRAFNSFDLLQFIMQDKTELIDVLADDLGKHAVIAGRVTEPDDLRHLVQFPRDAVVQRAFLQVDANKSDDIVTKLFEVHVQFCTFNNGQFLQLLDPDVNCATRYK